MSIILCRFPVKEFGSEKFVRFLGGASAHAGGVAEGIFQATFGLKFRQLRIAHNATVVDDQNAVAEVFHFLQNVGGQHHGFGLAYAFDEGANLYQLIGIQSGGGFVQDENFGVVEQGRSQAHALAVALGQLSNDLVAFWGQSRLRNHFFYTLGRCAVQAGHKMQILRDVEVRVQRIVFREVPYFLLDVQGVGTHFKTAHLRVPAGGRQITGQDFHQGTFTGAVGPQEAYNLAVGQVKGDGVQRFLFAVEFGEVGNADRHGIKSFHKGKRCYLCGMSATATFPGTVVKATGSWFQVRLDDGTERACRLRGQLRLKGSKSTSFVAVGDRVELEDEGAEQAVIIALHDRRNYILRKSVNLSHRTQVIAANLDQAVLVTTVSEPKTLFGFIDRFLATAEAYSVPAVLVFNKMDALSEADRDELEYREAAYGAAGYRTLRTSALTGEGLEELRSLLANKVTLFSGHSGVGKSSLANALDPSLTLRTQAVSTAHGQGQHTTTFAEMHLMAGNINLIDTPGIRGFGIVSMEASEIGDYFPEIFALRSQCRFADCSHTEEPGCAVRDAVEAHKLAPTRYRSYLSMLHGVDDDDPYRQDAYKI